MILDKIDNAPLPAVEYTVPLPPTTDPAPAPSGVVLPSQQLTVTPNLTTTLEKVVKEPKTTLGISVAAVKAEFEPDFEFDISPTTDGEQAVVGQKHPSIAEYSGEILHFTLIGDEDDLSKVNIMFQTGIDKIDGLDIIRFIQMLAPIDTQWIRDQQWHWAPNSPSADNLQWREMRGTDGDVYAQATRVALGGIIIVQILPRYCYINTCAPVLADLKENTVTVSVVTPTPEQTQTPIPRDYSRLPDEEMVKRSLMRAGFDFSVPDDSPFSVLRYKGVGRSGSEVMVARDSGKAAFVTFRIGTTTQGDDADAILMVMLEFIATFNPNEMEVIADWVTDNLIRIGTAYAKRGWYEYRVEKTFNDVTWEVEIDESKVVSLIVSWD